MNIQNNPNDQAQLRAYFELGQARTASSQSAQTTGVSQNTVKSTPQIGAPQGQDQVDTSNTFGLGVGGEIDEEQFQHALVKYVLEEMNPEAAALYAEAFEQAVAQGIPTEDAVKVALKAIVEAGVISQEEAEKVNGITFRAAQLDDNLDALYDGRGGPGDPTVAKASVEDAIAKAEAVFQAAEAGELTMEARSLDAPSNVAPSAASSSVGGHSSVGGSGEFLWKPQSDSDGKLVVLLPSQYTGQVVSAGIYSDLPPSAANRIEEGRYAGDANGGRAHFRFSKDGGSYPDGVYVVAKLSDGRTVSFPIGESSARNTK